MAVLVGKKAPEFKARATDGGEIKDVALTDYAGKWVVLFFYPLDFTFVCPTEIKAYNEMNAAFVETGAVVLGASIDSAYSHAAWIQRDFGGKLNFPLIADVTKEISRKFGVLNEDAGIALRGTFVIDPNGIVQSETINNLSVGRNTEETLRTLKAFQSGELCPVNWKKGEATLGKA
ncbi:MAG: peroxiredoxin [bacterium]